MLSLSRHTGKYISAIILTPLKIVFNKPQPSILLHLKYINTESSYPCTARSQTLYYLPACTVTCPKTSRRTTTAHTSSSTLSSKKMHSISRISECLAFPGHGLLSWACNPIHTMYMIEINYIQTTAIFFVLKFMHTHPPHTSCSYSLLIVISFIGVTIRCKSLQKIIAIYSLQETEKSAI